MLFLRILNVKTFQSTSRVGVHLQMPSCVLWNDVYYCDVIHWRYYDVFVYTFSSDVMCAIVASPMILWGVLLNQSLTEDYFTVNCSIDYFTKIFNVNCPGDNAMNKFESRAGMLRWNKALWLVRNSHGIWISQSVIT